MDGMDIGLYITYALFGLAVVAAILLPLASAIKSPSGLLKSLAGVGGLVAVFLIAFVMSGSEVSQRAAANGINETSSKLIGAGLTMFYIVFVLAAVGVIYSEINKALK